MKNKIETIRDEWNTIIMWKKLQIQMRIDLCFLGVSLKSYESIVSDALMQMQDQCV